MKIAASTSVKFSTLKNKYSYKNTKNPLTFISIHYHSLLIGIIFNFGGGTYLTSTKIADLIGNTKFVK